MKQNMQMEDERLESKEAFSSGGPNEMNEQCERASTGVCAQSGNVKYELLFITQFITLFSAY